MRETDEDDGAARFARIWFHFWRSCRDRQRLILRNLAPNGYKAGVFQASSTGGEDEKRAALSRGDMRFDSTRQRLEFAKIPGSPVAYWVSGRLSVAPSASLDCLEDLALFRQGMSTTAADRFEREWTEIDSRLFNTKRAQPLLDSDPPSYWYPFNRRVARGPAAVTGISRRSSADERNGEGSHSDLATGQISEHLGIPEFGDQESESTSSGLLLRTHLLARALSIPGRVPTGCAYSVAGPAIFPEDWNPALRVSFLMFFNYDTVSQRQRTRRSASRLQMSANCQSA